MTPYAKIIAHTLPALAVFLVLGLLGCGKPSNAENNPPKRVIVDSDGRHVEIPVDVRRVVCIGPGALRYAVYADGVKKIAGVEFGEGLDNPAKCFSYAYRSIFSKLPIIGRNGTPNEEAIVVLSPDVIITTNSPESANAMQLKTGIPAVTIPIPESAFDDDARSALRIVGEVLGTQDRCLRLWEYIKSLEADLKSRTSFGDSYARPNAYIGGVSFRGAHGLEGTQSQYPPFEAVGANNLADSIGIQGAFDVDIEQIIKWDPQYIFLEINNIALIEGLLEKRPEILETLSAVREDRVYSNVAFRFSATNTEMAIANAYYVGKVLYPEKFSDIDIEKKTDEITKEFLGIPLYSHLKKSGCEFKKINLKKFLK